MKQKVWLTLITCLAYCVDRELYKAIDYLKEQVRFKHLFGKEGPREEIERIREVAEANIEKYGLISKK